MTAPTFRKPPPPHVAMKWPVLAGIAPAYTSDLCAFYVGDSFAMLDALTHEIEALRAGRRVHLLTDPPYDEHTHTKMLVRKERTPGAGYNEFDFKDIGFDALDDKMIDTLGRLFCSLVNGWSLIFTTDVLSSVWRAAMVHHGAFYRRLGLWVKSNPMPKVLGDGPAQGHEPFVISWHDTGLSEWNGGGRANIWTGTKDSSVIHKTQKPLWLGDSLIEHFTSRGELVVDPFAGSATFGVSAVKAGRRVILMERDEKMAVKAIDRVSKQREQLMLFGADEGKAKQVALLPPEPKARAPRRL